MKTIEKTIKLYMCEHCGKKSIDKNCISEHEPNCRMYAVKAQAERQKALLSGFKRVYENKAIRLLMDNTCVDEVHILLLDMVRSANVDLEYFHDDIDYVDALMEMLERQISEVGK